MGEKKKKNIHLQMVNPDQYQRTDQFSLHLFIKLERSALQVHPALMATVEPDTIQRCAPESEIS